MKKLIWIMVLVFILAGCRQVDMPEDTEVNSTVVPITVKISTIGDALVGKEIIIDTKVEKGNQVITEADDVVVEIRKSGSDHRELLDAKNMGDGIYQVMHTFSDAGKYYIVSHVTADGLHVMPEKEIVVSEQGAKETAVHPKVNYDIVFTNIPVKSGKENKFEAAIEMEGEPLKGAAVFFEYWKEGSTDSKLLKAQEGNDGKYEKRIQFTEPGTYKVQVHVEKDDFHEHQLQTVEVP